MFVRALSLACIRVLLSECLCADEGACVCVCLRACVHECVCARTFEHSACVRVFR